MIDINRRAWSPGEPMRRRYWRAALTFLPYLRRYPRLAASSLALMGLGALTALAQPWPLALLVDYVLSHRPPPGGVTAIFGRDPAVLIVVAVVGGFLLVLLIHSIAVLNEWVNTRLNLSIALDFRSDLFAHCQELTDFFTDEAAPGDFMYRINYEARAVGDMAVALPPILQSLLTLIGMFVIALLLDAELALLALVVVPFIYWSTGYYAKRIEPRLVSVRGLEGLSLTMVNQAMSMVHVITGFNRQRDEYLRFRRQGEIARDARVGLTVRQTVFSLVVALITAAGVAVVLGVGAWHVLTGRMTVGGLLVLMSYIHSIYQPLETLAHTVSQLQVNLVSILFSRQLLERRPAVVERPAAVALERVRGHVRFENVSFSYPGREGTLRDISFEVQPGELVAIVGPTGAGKSTLTQLLPRFLDPDSGAIFLDGHDLRDLTLASVRDQIAMVRQEPLLFPRTIAENIVYGRPELGMPDVIEAARAAGAHDFIEALPDGYETVLGERGARISGGERQRLAIARAFLKDAPILVLDEPTASVDSKTELGILEALERLTAGRTTFIVAHRLSTVRAASRVLVLDHGALIEEGKPAELLARGGFYAMLTRLQTLDMSHPVDSHEPISVVNASIEVAGTALAVTASVEASKTSNGTGHGVANGNGHRAPAVHPGGAENGLRWRNRLVERIDRSLRRGVSYTGALVLDHRAGQARIHVEDGRLRHAEGAMGHGDELVVQALSWRDGDFDLTLENGLTTSGKNISMTLSELMAEAARRQEADLGALDLARLRWRNQLVERIALSLSRGGAYTGTIVLRRGEASGHIFIRQGALYHAGGELGDADDMVAQALSWRDEDFTFRFDESWEFPPERNMTMSLQDLVLEAARRQEAIEQQATDADAAGTPEPLIPSLAALSRPIVVVLGSMSPMPVGGVIWQTIQYLLGFQRLGCETYYVEAHGRYPHMLTQSAEEDGGAVAAGFIRDVMHRIDFDARWALHAHSHTPSGGKEQVYGMSRAALDDLYRNAALIINLHGGTIPRPEHTSGPGRLVYLETDPVPIQVYVAQGRQGDVDFLGLHDAFFSYGENYGAADCGVPQSPLFEFKPTRPPVLMDLWPFDESPAQLFTTIGNWSQHQDVSLGGETYTWSKKHEFLKFLDLPRVTTQKIELALSQCPPPDRRHLLDHGWRVVDALRFSYDAEAYRAYIARSRAEFTVAKDQNVRLRSGWFSDRSATYLASGRPVVTQDTGFGNVLPTGLGLFAFNSVEEAVAAIAEINGDYKLHRRAARDLAHEYFDSDLVLGRILRAMGLPVRTATLAPV